MMRNNEKKHPALRVILSIVAAIVVLAVGGACVYTRFGGFGTGECADVDEFSKYAGAVCDISIPDETRVVALGEATHGNSEFQQLRLDVFKVLVERCGVRAFALEADFGACEGINRYIHGEEGSAAKALAATGFAIYRTQEMEDLVEWMRDYNTKVQTDKLSFYGFDMEQYAYSFRYLLDELKKENADTTELESIWDDKKGAYRQKYSAKERSEIIEKVKDEIPEDNAWARQLAAVLIQNIELGKYIDDSGELNEHRDSMMEQNILWISQRERALGNECIMISGHNNHVMKCESPGMVGMGALLAKELKNGYYVIGTDFYRSTCNLPKPFTGKRFTHVFYSYDPLAKAAKKCGFDVSFLDFSKIPETSALNEQLSGEICMGSLGESYSILMDFMPKSYRVMRTPRAAYDAMIFVTDARPIEIKPAE